MTIRLSPHGGQLRHVRRLADAWAQAVEAGWDVLPLIATELLSNALAASPPGDPVEVVFDAAPGSVWVSVRDAGAGLKSRSFSPPPPSSTRGRGLSIVDQLCDHLSIDRQGGFTVVTARKLTA